MIESNDFETNEGSGGGTTNASDLTSGTLNAARLPGVLADVDTQAELLSALGDIEASAEPPASATTSTITVDTTSGGVSLKATGAGLRGFLATNNGATDCYLSFSGTAVSGATAVTNGGHLLPANGGEIYMDAPGALVIKGITASGSTVVAVSLFD